MAEKKADDAQVVATPKEEVPALKPAAQPAKRADVTIPGGRYVVDGQPVDANGKPIKE